jgi:hypothetical protein
MQCVYCEVSTEFLYIEVTFMLERMNTMGIKGKY